MKKRKIHWFAFLFSAIAAAALFYFIARHTFLFFWKFDLLSSKHWNHIIGKWKSGWVLHKPKEIFFFVSLLLLLPGYFFTWFIVYIFPLKRILFAPKTFIENRKKAKLQAQSLAAALGPADKTQLLKTPEKKEHKAVSPKMAALDRLRGKKPIESAPPATKQAAPDNTAATRFDLWEKLAKDLDAAKIFNLRYMKIHSFVVNILAVTQESVFLLCEGPSQGESWEVNDEASPPVWKTENGDIPSPLTAMITAKNTLQNYLEEQNSAYASMNINCCLILDHGNITNTDVLLAFLEKENISVLRMGSCKSSVLPDPNALIGYITSQGTSSQETNDAIALAILDLTEIQNDG